MEHVINTMEYVINTMEHVICIKKSKLLFSLQFLVAFHAQKAIELLQTKMENQSARPVLKVSQYGGRAVPGGNSVLSYKSYSKP